LRKAAPASLPRVECLESDLGPVGTLKRVVNPQKKKQKKTSATWEKGYCASKRSEWKGSGKKGEVWG